MVRELVRYKLDLVGVQEVWWNKRGTQLYFFNGTVNNYQLGTGGGELHFRPN